ncbi:MAG TPA: hypothetical protein VHZ51_24875 [Ktedonobacteraceae bacterium]|jgi:hypothetical protein|nr:hypothetical protein [Ktedonobacteraceae bacterium]
MSNLPYGSDPRYQQQDPRYQQPTEAYSDPNEQTFVTPSNRAGYENREQPQNRQEYVQNRQVNTNNGRVERSEEIYANSEQQRANIRYWVARVVYFICGVLEVILGLRFIFRLLGASEYSSFVAGLYSFSYGFVAPFSGIFNNPGLGAGRTFELTTLIAMVIYALIAWGIVALSKVVFSPTLTGRSSYTIERRRRDV